MRARERDLFRRGPEQRAIRRPIVSPKPRSPSPLPSCALPFQSASARSSARSASCEHRPNEPPCEINLARGPRKLSCETRQRIARVPLSGEFATGRDRASQLLRRARSSARAAVSFAPPAPSWRSLRRIPQSSARAAPDHRGAGSSSAASSAGCARALDEFRNDFAFRRGR